MLKRTFCLTLIFVFACSASADLVGYWSFDEGAGTVANDGSGNNNHGEVVGGAQWVAGKLGGALAFDGADDMVVVEHNSGLPIYNNGTDNVWSIAMWVKGGPQNDMRIFSEGSTASNNPLFNLGTKNDGATGQLDVYIRPAGLGHTFSDAEPFDDTWHHIAWVDENGAAKLYVDGVLDGGNFNYTRAELDLNTTTIGGILRANPSHWFTGMIDDVQIYNHALTEAEVLAAMDGLAPKELAKKPSPENEQTDVIRDATLTWESGQFAVTHNVYVGTSFEDVNNATTGVSMGQTDSAYDAGVLAFGQTYYWRVDEVNSAPDNTIFKGDVWSFTVEPYSIPVEMISATASSSHSDVMGPENTINGVGLDELDQHSTEGTDMWLSGMGDAAPSIQYEFDKAYKLHELWVWNSNQLIEAFVGIGAKDVTIEYSIDGTEWVILENASEFSQAPGNASYTANTIVDFGGALAKQVKITINSGYGMLPQYGLSEVRFYYIPTLAREPQPANGAITDGANVVLSWRAGREAASHQVYLGTDAGELALAGTATENSYDAGVLDYDTTYYWQITEVNEAETPSFYAGPIWSFTTPAFGTVDSFDLYDDNCERIFFAWEDGLGHSGGEDIEGCDVAPSNGNGGGSIVGNDMAPFAEQTIVYAGRQSLPFDYDNAFGQSEATLTLDGQDWTASGVQSLSLMFYGSSDNSGQLYVKINNTKVVYDGAAEDIKGSQWQAWIIDLTALSGLQNVMSLTIGVEGASAAGRLYIDEIRLYPLPGEPVVPAQPSADGLVAYLSFDEGSGTSAADGSGNNNHGDVMGVAGDAQWVAGKVGGALAFDGVDDIVVVSQNSGLPIYNNGTDNAYSVTLWVRGGPQNDMRVFSEGSTTSNNPLLNLGTHNSASPTGQFASYIRPDTGTTSNHPLSQAEPFDDTWHHIAWVDDNGTARLYVDGHLDGGDFSYTRGTMALDTTTVGGILRAAPSHFFFGEIDEVRIYNRALSQAEAAWLAGKTAPFAKPF